MKRNSLSTITTILAVVLAIGLTAPAPAGATAGKDGPGLGEWSADCERGFRIAAMPSAWTFNPAHGPLMLITHVAIDYEFLPQDSYEIIGYTEGEGEAILHPSGYTFMAMEAQVRH